MSVNVHRTEDGRLMVPEGPSRREDQAYDARTGKPVEVQLSESVDRPGMACYGLGYHQVHATPEWLIDQSRHMAALAFRLLAKENERLTARLDEVDRPVNTGWSV